MRWFTRNPALVQDCEEEFQQFIEGTKMGKFYPLLLFPLFEFHPLLSISGHTGGSGDNFPLADWLAWNAEMGQSLLGFPKPLVTGKSKNNAKKNNTQATPSPIFSLFLLHPPSFLTVRYTLLCCVRGPEGETFLCHRGALVLSTERAERTRLEIEY